MTEMKMMDLNGEWSGRGMLPSGEVIEFCGNVPGCVHTDLYREGKISNPLYGENFKDCQWIENCNWIYSKKFDYNSNSTNDAYIKFECLDVECDIFLNNVKVGSADNMFIEHTFYIGDNLNMGENEIQVVFYAHTQRCEAMPKLHGAFTKERMHKRRMQCTYGWDWVERFVTCGIEKSVSIIRKEKCEIDNIYLYTKSADERLAEIVLDTEFTGASPETVAEYTIYDPDGKKIFEKKLLVVEDCQYQNITIEEPQRWYPNGYGDSPLYKLEVKVCERESVIDAKCMSFGIRTVRIIEKIDKVGSEYYNKCLEIKKGGHLKDEWDNWDENTEFSGFIVEVNGVPVMCKGGCWVPSNPFVSEQSDEKIKATLKLSADANVNMIRVWGGGMFEKNCFYEECDRLGIMVTQDMLMACGQYPDGESDFCEHMRKEAEYAAYKLRNHPCLVFWSGDNENAIRANDNMVVYDGRRVVRGVIAKVMKKLDYSRRFLPSSPYGGIPYGSPTFGTTHNSQFLGAMLSYIRSSDMKDCIVEFNKYLSRFVVEAPTFGVCSPETMKYFMTEDDIYGDNCDVEIAHTRNNPGLNPGLYDYMTIFTKKVIGDFKNADDKLRKLQFVQYEQVRNCLELYRRNKGFSQGILFWQLNDCWPTYGSWSLIDFYNFPKASYYAFKRAAKGVVTSILRENNSFKVYVCNDTLSDVRGDIVLRKVNKDSVLKEWKISCKCEANRSCVVLEIPERDVELTDAEVLICDAFGDRTILYNTNPAAFEHMGCYNVVAESDDKITVKAEELVTAVELKGEYIFEDNYFILLPGEEKTISRAKFVKSQQM